jgi:hypothetical protein
MVRMTSLRAGASVGCGCGAAFDEPSDRDLGDLDQPLMIAPEIGLIRSGKLPPADSIDKASGRPLWSLAGIACLLGISLPELMSILHTLPSQPLPRYSEQSVECHYI